MTESGVTKKRKNGQLKYHNIYVLNNMQDNSKDRLLENAMDYYYNKDENVEKVMLLTTEVLEKDKIFEIMKIHIDKDNEVSTIMKRKK